MSSRVLQNPLHPHPPGLLRSTPPPDPCYARRVAGDYSLRIFETTVGGAGPAPLTPDFDGDETVGFSDFLQFALVFGAREGDGRFEARFDLDGSGDIGFTDFIVFAGAFGSASGR